MELKKATINALSGAEIYKGKLMVKVILIAG